MSKTFTIDLTQGQKAIVDERDWPRLRRHKWCATWDLDTRSFRARRSVRYEGKLYTIHMHREILGLSRGDGKQVDHWNHDSLDNRRRNLRVVTKRGNAENRRDQSIHGVGVRFRKDYTNRPYGAHAKINGQSRHIGAYATAREARAARKRFLKDVRLA